MIAAVYVIGIFVTGCLGAPWLCAAWLFVFPYAASLIAE